ncbi:lytic transglycosylase domain-containing protein [Candidatus Bipolaricaulota bacterium]|nr:lytic transglycosylase domain-containing protein [Candidatus Bipolaricaulota bacterium]
MPPVARKHRWKLRSILLVISASGLIFTALIGLRIFAPLQYRDEIIQWSATYYLDPAWVASVIRCESGFRPLIVSPAGAIGLMQIMPETGKWIAEQLSWPDPSSIQLQDVETNITLGTWYLRYLLDRFHTADVALMAYNAGPTNADHWEGNLEQAFAETQQYIRRMHLVLPIYRTYFKALWFVDLVPSARFLY